MTNPIQNRKAPGLAAAAGARSRSAVPAAVPPAPPPAAKEDLEDFDDEAETPATTATAAPAEPEEPAFVTRKQAEKEAKEAKLAAKKNAVSDVKPTDDFIRDKKGNVRKDEDGDEMRFAPGFHKGAGFVNENGVRFPPGFKFKGGHVGTFGSVVLNKCPQCGYRQSVDEALSGACQNMKAGPDKQPCGFSQVALLAEYAPSDIK